MDLIRGDANRTEPPPAHSWRLLWRVGVFVGLLITLLGLPAAPAAAETTLDVTTPADGRFQPGGRTPLIVTIQADRAISGTLNATFDGFRAGSQRVEVPGGSAKEIVFIVTVPPWSGNGSVSFAGDDSADDETVSVNLLPAGGDELVGVLPELAARDLPASADVASEIGVARLFALDVELLDAGSDALGSFSQILATSGDLQALAGDRLAAIESWVGADGGLLVIDEEPGTPLPIELDTTSAVGEGIYGFGLGLVQFSDGQAAAGAYDGLLRPTASGSPDEFPWGGGFGGGFPTTSILASDAGVRVPAIGSIVLVLIAYTVVVGPVLWFLLRRTRREPLLWLVLPALALLTTGGVYIAGQALRDETSTAHATLYADLPTQRLVSSQALVTAPNGGTTGVVLPTGWRPSRVVSEEFMFDGPFGPNGGAPTSEPVLRGDDLEVDLPPGGVGVVGAETTLPTAGASWGYAFEPDEDDLVGTVTNLTSFDLEEVFVTSGQGFTRLSSVEAGETVEVTLRGVSDPPINGDPFMERLWQFDGFSGDADGVMNPGLLMDWMGARPELRSPGFIMIVGWTRDETGPLATSRGSTIENGRTAFLTADRLDASLISTTQGRTEFLRGWGSTSVSDPPRAGECTDFPLTVRITPAAEVVDADPVLSLQRRAIASFDVWDGSAWLPAGMADAQNNDLAVALPRTAFADGSLYARMQMSCEFWGVRNPFPTVRSATADDDVLMIGALGAGQPDGADVQGDTTTTTPPPPGDAPATTVRGAG